LSALDVALTPAIGPCDTVCAISICFSYAEKLTHIALQCLVLLHIGNVSWGFLRSWINSGLEFHMALNAQQFCRVSRSCTATFPSQLLAHFIHIVGIDPWPFDLSVGLWVTCEVVSIHSRTGYDSLCSRESHNH